MSCIHALRSICFIKMDKHQLNHRLRTMPKRKRQGRLLASLDWRNSRHGREVILSLKRAHPTNGTTLPSIVCSGAICYFFWGVSKGLLVSYWWTIIELQNRKLTCWEITYMFGIHVSCVK